MLMPSLEEDPVISYLLLWLWLFDLAAWPLALHGIDSIEFVSAVVTGIVSCVFVRGPLVVAGIDSRWYRNPLTLRRRQRRIDDPCILLREWRRFRWFVAARCDDKQDQQETQHKLKF
jgi:hypothetical protein